MNGGSTSFDFHYICESDKCEDCSLYKPLSTDYENAKRNYESKLQAIVSKISEEFSRNRMKDGVFPTMKSVSIRRNTHCSLSVELTFNDYMAQRLKSEYVWKIGEELKKFEGASFVRP